MDCPVCRTIMDGKLRSSGVPCPACARNHKLMGCHALLRSRAWHSRVGIVAGVLLVVACALPLGSWRWKTMGAVNGAVILYCSLRLAPLQAQAVARSMWLDKLRDG